MGVDRSGKCCQGPVLARSDRSWRHLAQRIAGDCTGGSTGQQVVGLPVFKSYGEYKSLMDRFTTISRNVDCPHNLSHILSYVIDLLSLPSDMPGCIVEAGCYKGGSTAKVSIVASMLKRQLVVFDSFEGLPENNEQHDRSILGHSIEGWFDGGKFSGTMDEVKRNVTQYGDISVCRFIRGWFDDTLPGFSEPICAAYIDVDLASSTRTCIKYLYPLIVPGGLLVSQDGDFPLVIDVFRDERFWEEEVGYPKPEIQGLGSHKIIRIVKPAGVTAAT